MKELQKHIKNNSFARVYLLTGDEPYQLLQGKLLLKRALVREDDTMNFQEYKEERPNLTEIRDTAQTMPFFSEKRLCHHKFLLNRFPFRIKCLCISIQAYVIQYLLNSIN